MGAEFAVAGVSSQSVWEGVLEHTKMDSPLLPLTVFDGAKLGLPGPVPNLNTTFRCGTKAGATLAATSNLAAAQAARNLRQNRHLAYCDTSAYGIGRVEVTEARCVVELISIASPLSYRGETGANILRRIRFTVPAWAPGQASAKLEEPQIEGQAAFPV